jgi:putative FmdB family regulatory protein
MPVYLFRCTTCVETFERWRPERRRDDPMTCPRGHETVTRLPGLEPREGEGPASRKLPPHAGQPT